MVDDTTEADNADSRQIIHGYVNDYRHDDRVFIGGHDNYHDCCHRECGGCCHRYHTHCHHHHGCCNDCCGCRHDGYSYRSADGICKHCCENNDKQVGMAPGVASEDFADMGVDHQAYQNGGHIHPMVPHIGDQVPYSHGVYDNEYDAHGSGHVHPPIPYPNGLSCCPQVGWCNHQHNGPCYNHHSGGYGEDLYQHRRAIIPINASIISSDSMTQLTKGILFPAS